MSFEDVSELFARKRSIEILHLLSEEKELNFKDIVERVPSSSDTISKTLKLLIEYNLVERDQRSVIDVRYHITSRGEKVLNKVGEISALIREGDRPPG